VGGVYLAELGHEGLLAGGDGRPALGLSVAAHGLLGRLALEDHDDVLVHVLRQLSRERRRQWRG